MSADPAAVHTRVLPGRRGRRACLLFTAVALVTAVGACSPPAQEGRVGDAGVSTDDQPGGAGAGPVGAEATTTTFAPATSLPTKAATNAGNICRGRADSFLPDTVAGYSVAASGDITGALPPGAKGVQSAGAALVRRDGDNAEGLVSAVVFEEQPALSAVVSSTMDLFLQAAAGKADVTDTAVNGYEARTTTGPGGTTVIAWAECLNVWMLVQAPTAPMAADVAAKTHSP